MLKSFRVLISVKTFLKFYSAATTTVLLSIFLLNFWVHKAEYEAGQRYQIDSEVQLLAASLLQALTDRETGQRGYLLTIDEAFLEPYTEAGERLNQLMSELQPYIDPQEWQWMVNQIAARNDYFNSTFAMVRGPDVVQGQKQAIEMVRAGTGKAYMDSFRDSLSLLLADRQRESDLLKEEVQNYVRAAEILALVSLILLITLSLLPIYLFKRKLLIPLTRLQTAFSTFSQTREAKFTTSDNAFEEVKTLTQSSVTAAESLLQAERKLAIALKDSKEQTLYLSLTSEAMGLGLWRFDKANGTVFWNTAYRKMMGVEHDKTLSVTEATSTWWNRIHPDDREAVQSEMQSLEKLPTHTTGHSMQYRIVTNTGEFRWLNTQLNLDRNEMSEIRIVTAAVIDVTEIELSRQSLDKQVAHTEALNRLGTVSRWEYDSAGQTTYFDTLMSNWTGLYIKPGHPYSLNLLCDVMTREQRGTYRRSVKEMISRLLVHREISEYTFEHQLKNRVIQVRAERVRLDGRDWIFGCSVDVTELIHRQRELEVLLAREEIATQRQREMFAIIGHELRTPVASIEMITSDEEMDFESQRQHVNSIAHSLLNILEDLRVVVSPDRALEAQAVNANPTDTLSRTLLPLVSFVESKGLKLTSDLPYTDNHLYTFQAQALRQIATNLVKNASIHSKGSSVRVEFDINSQDDRSATARLVVRDDGKGIPESHRERIFDAFTRGDGQQDGSGLGLFIVRELVKKLDGTLEVFNTPSGGACFEIEFPLLRSNLPSELPESDLYENLCGLHVLLAEDDKTLRLLSAKALEKRGATVDAFENGALALEAFDSGDYDLVITDLMMPEMDGHALTQEIRARGSQTPIFAVTAAVIGDETELFRELGANAVIPKPINLKRVAQELRNLGSEATAD